MKRIRFSFSVLMISMLVLLTSCAGTTVIPHIGTNGNWFVGATDLGVSATGAAGEQGPKGDKGEVGEKGEDGEIGATGAKGDKGDTGAQGPQGEQGPKGDKGSTGAAGKNGLTPHIGENGNWWIGTEDTGVYAGAYEEACTDGLEFSLRTHEGRAGAVVTGYFGEETEVVIPSFFASFPVIGMDASAFFGNEKITSVRLSSNMLSLPEGAFKGCENLASVDFNGAKITEIPADAFSGTAIGSLVLPNGVQAVDLGAFPCDMNTVIYIPKSVTTAKGSFCGALHLAFEADSLSSSWSDALADAPNVRYCLGLKNSEILFDAELSMHLVYEDGGYSILAYDPAPVGILTLPSVYNDAPIRRIRSQAILLSEETKDLILSPCLTRLDAEAITAVSPLRAVYVPSSVGEAAPSSLCLLADLYLFEAASLADGIHADMAEEFSEAEKLFSIPVGTLGANEDYLYLLHTEGVTLLRYLGNADTVVIPDRIENKPIVAIQSGFLKTYYTTAISVPETVTFVGRHAFIFLPYENGEGEKMYFPCTISFPVDHPPVGYDLEMIRKDEEDLFRKTVTFIGTADVWGFSK